MNESASIWLVSARSWVSLTPMKSLTCMMTAALLLAFGCSKDDPAAPAAPKNVGGSGGNTAGPGGMGGDGGEITVDGNGGPQTPEGTQRVNEDPNAPPVLAEMAGLYYEVYQIADKPYTGKVVEYHATNVEKSEKVYEVGRLTSFTEWHENAQKSHEVTYAADGKITEKVWVSAHDGRGIDDLLAAISRVLAASRQRYQVQLPISAGALRAKLYERGTVKAESQTEQGDWEIEIELSDSALGWLRKQPNVQGIASY